MKQKAGKLSIVSPHKDPKVAEKLQVVNVVINTLIRVKNEHPKGAESMKHLEKAINLSLKQLYKFKSEFSKQIKKVKKLRPNSRYLFRLCILVFSLLSICL